VSELLIRRLADADLDAAADVHAQAFPRQQASREWLACNARAFPRMQLFVAEEARQVIGYAMWAQKAGFRAEAVLELEQIAVAPAHQGRGVGEALIRRSLAAVVEHLAERGARLKNVLVTTRADNAAQRLYRRVLGAEVEATITGLYSADEVLMVARAPLDALAAGS
jgi:ribosomal protein S18 acetylase RimI-like enzyme